MRTYDKSLQTKNGSRLSDLFVWQQSNRYFMDQSGCLDHLSFTTHCNDSLFILPLVKLQIARWFFVQHTNINGLHWLQRPRCFLRYFPRRNMENIEISSEDTWVLLKKQSASTFQRCFFMRRTSNNMIFCV